MGQVSNKLFLSGVVQFLFTLNAFVWIGLGAGTFLRLGDMSPQLKVIIAIMGVMMFGRAGTFFVGRD